MAKYGEMALKGLNKRTFEDILLKNVRNRLSPLGKFEYYSRQSTLFISVTECENADAAVEAVTKIFGISAVQRSLAVEKTYDALLNGLPYLAKPLSAAKTFKVEAKRADKTFPMKSPEIQNEYGGAVLEAHPHLTVDVHNPDITVTVEVRDRNAYISAERIEGARGLPVGSSGRALLLLSGGIDSPVAAYMTARRGVIIEAVHFQSPPYTSERALMKVRTLCDKLTPYLGTVRLHTVNFTKIQEAIRDSVCEEYFTVIMRRLMIKIANKIARYRNCGALVTGESIGQVASQTLPAIACTDAVADFPVLRPVIGMDKVEITATAVKIDTFETSILPYEDCCTVFTPRHPKTRPGLREIESEEAKFDYTALLAEAAENTTVYETQLI